MVAVSAVGAEGNGSRFVLVKENCFAVVVNHPVLVNHINARVVLSDFSCNGTGDNGFVVIVIYFVVIRILAVRAFIKSKLKSNGSSFSYIAVCFYKYSVSAFLREAETLSIAVNYVQACLTDFIFIKQSKERHNIMLRISAVIGVNLYKEFLICSNIEGLVLGKHIFTVALRSIFEQVKPELPGSNDLNIKIVGLYYRCFVPAEISPHIVPAEIRGKLIKRVGHSCYCAYLQIVGSCNLAAVAVGVDFVTRITERICVALGNRKAHARKAVGKIGIREAVIKADCGEYAVRGVVPVSFKPDEYALAGLKTKCFTVEITVTVAVAGNSIHKVIVKRNVNLKREVQVVAVGIGVSEGGGIIVNEQLTRISVKR